MMIVAIALSLIIILAFVMGGKPTTSYNPSKPFYDQTMDEDKHDVILPDRPAFPAVVPQIDITQPLLYPVVPNDSLTHRPEKSDAVYPASLFDFPCRIDQDPRNQLYWQHPQSAYRHADLGTPFGDGKVSFKLPHTTTLCHQIGVNKPPTFHLKGDVSIHGDHVVVPVVDKNGDVVPHVYITQWNKYTGNVTIRNDVTNWHGDITLAYYEQCNFPDSWEDELEVTKHHEYTVTI